MTKANDVNKNMPAVSNDSPSLDPRIDKALDWAEEFENFTADDESKPDDKLIDAIAAHLREHPGVEQVDHEVGHWYGAGFQDEWI